MGFNTRKIVGFCTAVAASTTAYISYYSFFSDQGSISEVPPTPYLNLTLNFNQFNHLQCPNDFSIDASTKPSFQGEESKFFEDWGFLLLGIFKDPVFTILKESNSAIYKLWFKSVADGVMQLGAYAFSLLGLKHIGETLFLPGKMIKKPIEATKSSSESAKSKTPVESSAMICLMQYLQEKSAKGEEIDLHCGKDAILIRDQKLAHLIREVQDQQVDAEAKRIVALR